MTTPSASIPSGRANIVIFTIIMTVLIGSAAGFRFAQRSMDAVLHKESVPLRQPFFQVPTTVGQWKRFEKDDVLSKEVLEELGTDLYLTRRYARGGDPSRGFVTLHLTYYTGIIDAVPHIPERCFVGGGLEKSANFSLIDVPLDKSTWRPETTVRSADSNDTPPVMVALSQFGEAVRMPRLNDETLRINASEYWRPEDPDHRIAAGYFFIANGAVTPHASGVRALAFKLTDEHAYYCKVQFTLVEPDGTNKETLAQIAGEMLTDLLPEIMLCLPDWTEVESGVWPTTTQASVDSN